MVVCTNTVVNKKCDQEQFENFPEDENQSIVEYWKKYYKIWKNKTASQLKTDSDFG